MLTGRFLALNRLRLLSSKEQSIRSLSPHRLVHHPNRRLSKRYSVKTSSQLTPSSTTADAEMTEANGNSALVEEVESLRKQLESLKATLRQKEEESSPTVAPYSKSFDRTLITTILNSPSEGLALMGRTLRVGGWVKTGRVQGGGSFAFLALSDGTCAGNLQVMIDEPIAEEVGGLKSLTNTATSILVEGNLVECPPGKEQKVELKATKIILVGKTDGAEYPLAKKKQSYEFLREKAHLRPRTNTIAAVARIRNALAYATHQFFNQNGFLYVHTPIITASDCEGAGEMFQVTTLLNKADEAGGSAAGATATPTAADVEALKVQVAEQGDAVKAAKAAAAEDKGNADKAAASKAAVNQLLSLKQQLTKTEEAARIIGGIARAENGKIDYTKDFFGKPSYLTVSGQLNGEYYACGLSNVYTFGPTFRAENSHTARHLAEFWMIEPEIAFATLEDDMACAEDYVRHCCQHLLDNCRADLDFITKMIDPTALERLQKVASSPFKRITYTEAVEVLEEAVTSGKKKFEFQPKWGIDLQSEHERYLTEEVYKIPTIVYNYPKDIKAFYMRLNDDNKTVAAMDVLVPKVGELIGGSQREERLDVLERRIKETGMDLEPYSGYLDLRRYGTVPHAGFGLGFERLLLFATGLENIREVIPFPRWPGHAEY